MSAPGDQFLKVGKLHPQCCTEDGCDFLSKEGKDKCPAHAKGTHRLIPAGLKQYVLNNTLGQRAGVFVSSPALKSVNEEIALSRAVLEMVLQKIKTEDDATLFIERIDKSVNTISKLILDMQKIEEKNKELLDRATVFGIGDKIIEILVDHLPQDILLLVSEKIYEAITIGIGKPD